MAARTTGNVKPETEGDLQVMYFKILAVSTGDTVDISNWFKAIDGITLTGSTTAGLGFTASAGVLTIGVSTGTPDIWFRVVGH